MFVPSSRRSSLPASPTHLSKSPLFFRRRAFLQMFSLLATPCRGTEPLRAHAQTLLLAATHASARTGALFFCRNTPARNRAFCKRKQAHPVLSCCPAFGEFCIVSHETSAFSMFSTCLILLCFCPILIAFWRDLERKTRFLPAFPSHDRSPTFVLARRR